MSVSAGTNPIVAGRSVTLMATASQLASDTPPPGGQVTLELYNPVTGGMTSLGSATLLDGSASLTVATLPQGTDYIDANYGGGVSTDNTLYAYLSSQSGPAVESVNPQVKTASLQDPGSPSPTRSSARPSRPSSP